MSDMTDTKVLLPIDVRRKRIFWALAAFFVLLLFLAFLLIVLLLNSVSPPGFGATPVTGGVANFRASFFGPADNLFERPTDVAISPNGEVYISDTNNARVVVQDRDGTFIREISELVLASDADQENAAYDGYATPLEGTPTAFVAPTSLAFASDGRWFAVDQALRMVMFFTADDYLISGIIVQEEVPISVNVSNAEGSEQLFITTRSGVLQADLDGTFRHTYMNWGVLTGQLDNPAAVVVSNPADIDDVVSIPTTDVAELTIIADTLNNRVQAFRDFQTNPEVAWIFGTPIFDTPGIGDELPEFEGHVGGSVSAPVDLALSPLGRLFVVDGLSSEVIVLNARTGAYEYTISGSGTRDGLLSHPSGIEFLDGDIYVVDSFNDRISVFEDAPPAPAVEEVSEPREAPNRWLILLIPIAAFLAALVRLATIRMPRYIIDLNALESMAEDKETVLFVIEHFNSLMIVSGTESLAEEILPEYFWKSAAAKEEKRNEILEAYPALHELEADALALAQRGRSYVVTSTFAVERAGKDLGVKIVRFAEFRSVAHAYMEEDSVKDGEKVEEKEELAG